MVLEWVRWTKGKKTCRSVTMRSRIGTGIFTNISWFDFGWDSNDGGEWRMIHINIYMELNIDFYIQYTLNCIDIQKTN